MNSAPAAAPGGGVLRALAATRPSHGSLRQPASVAQAALRHRSVSSKLHWRASFNEALQASPVLPALSWRRADLDGAPAQHGLALGSVCTNQPLKQDLRGHARASASLSVGPAARDATGSTRAAMNGPIPSPRVGAQGTGSTRSATPTITPSSGGGEESTCEEAAAEETGGTAVRASDTLRAPPAGPVLATSTATATASAPAAQAQASEEGAEEAPPPIPALTPSPAAQRQPLAPLVALTRRSQRALLPPLESRTGGVQRGRREGLPVAHFAFGSNLSLEKLTSRVPGKLQPLSYEPAVVQAHRLAFNLAGLGLVEPTMASIEPCTGTHPADQGSEVHGLLVTLSPEDYDALYVSEGGAAGPFRAYLEYEVTARTYSGVEYQAIAFRANPGSRGTLPRNREQLPSRRYLNLIIRGAKERGLNAAYVQSLERKLARMRDPWNLLA